MISIVYQDILDRFWALHDAGATASAAAREVGISESLGRDLVHENRRIGHGCDLERRAEAVAVMIAAKTKGQPLHEAAKKAGLRFGDAHIEFEEHIKRVKDKRDREELRPPSYITAEPYSTEWYRQQDYAFGRAMLAAHPELFKETV